MRVWCERDSGVHQLLLHAHKLHLHYAFSTHPYYNMPQSRWRRANMYLHIISSTSEHWNFIFTITSTAVLLLLFVRSSECATKQTNFEFHQRCIAEFNEKHTHVAGRHICNNYIFVFWDSRACVCANAKLQRDVNWISSFHQSYLVKFAQNGMILWCRPCFRHQRHSWTQYSHTVTHANASLYHYLM